MSATNGQLLLCVEDELYRRYLERECTCAGLAYVAVGNEQMIQAIAERPSGTLLLQSESAEQNLIEASGKLKRLFGEDVRRRAAVVGLPDGRRGRLGGGRLLHYPVEFQEVQRPRRPRRHRPRVLPSTTRAWFTATSCRRCATRAIRSSRRSTAPRG